MNEAQAIIFCLVSLFHLMGMEYPGEAVEILLFAQLFLHEFI